VEIELYKDAKEDLAYWQKSGNKAVQKKIQELFKDMKNILLKVYASQNP